MEPTDKSPNIERFLKAIINVDRRRAVHEGFCTICGGEALEFKDALSEKEFSISGMCQKCQDKVLCEPEEE